MSGCTSPRLGTDPSGREKDSVCLMRLSSRRLSDPLTGWGSLVGEPLSGRKMVLNPGPWNVPVKADSGPKLGACGGTDVGALVPSWLGTEPNSKLLGRNTEGTRAPDSRLLLGMAQPQDAH